MRDSKAVVDPPTEVQMTAPVNGIVAGLLVGLTEKDQPLVIFAGSGTSQAVHARSLVALAEDDVGRSVALMFECGEPSRPIVIGCFHTSVPSEPPVRAQIDGEVVRLTAKEQLVLRCGNASITLTRAGKVLIRGAYVLSRSSGVNRLKGGSVQIN